MPRYSVADLHVVEQRVSTFSEASKRSPSVAVCC